FFLYELFVILIHYYCHAKLIVGTQCALHPPRFCSLFDALGDPLDIESVVEASSYIHGHHPFM
uniref:Uncharacterized protein n=1 Tax=Oryza brachyantha TaxID=4533 RepID=J3MF23_ORYBR